KPGREREVGDPQAALVEQPLGGLDPARSRGGGWGCANVLDEQPGEVALADAERRGEIGDAPAVEKAAVDQPESVPHHDERIGVQPHRWRGLWSAPPTRP